MVFFNMGSYILRRVLSRADIISGWEVSAQFFKFVIVFCHVL